MLTTSPRAKWYCWGHSTNWELRLSEVELLAQGHPTLQWQRQHLNSAPPNSHPAPSSHSAQPNLCVKGLSHLQSGIGRPAEEGSGWGGAGQEGSGVLHWGHHRGLTPPCEEALSQQSQQAPVRRPGCWGGRRLPTSLRKGRTQVCPPAPGSAPTTDAAAFAQGTCQGLRTSPTEPVVPKVQPLHIGIGVQ